jgi:NDP-sugar pyrophosphorylase family protein
MKALILIGGMGTRLRPLTCHTPKPLLPIVNKPFLEYQFELLRRHGVREIILCVAYLSHEFENHFGTGNKWGLKLRYVHEKEPLGTGGAIRNAARYIDEPTLIFNGDILTDIDLTGMLKYHKQKNAFITIALTRVKDPTIYGLVETSKNGKIERFLEKPSWDEVTCNTINAGMYLFEPDVMKFIPENINFSLERGLFPNLLVQGFDLFGYAFNGYWLDIGTVEKYMQAHGDLITGCVKYKLPGRRHNSGLWGGKNLSCGKNTVINDKLVCGDNVQIAEFVQFQGNVCLGSNVTIGKGSSLVDSVVLDGTRIDEGVRIENAIIGKNCHIEANASLGQGTALGNGTIVRKYSKL